MSHTSRENVQVVVRFRPLNSREKSLNDDDDFQLNVDTVQNMIDISKTSAVDRSRREKHQFIFDHVFDETISQKEVFNDVAKNAVEWVAEGYNATIFTYGPTGCLDPDTKVLMYDGTIKKTKDVVIGDLLMGDDSTPRKVSQLFSGIDDMYDVVPVKGKSYRVNKGHILTLKHSTEPIVTWQEKDNHYKVQWFKEGKNRTKTFAESHRGDEHKAEKRVRDFCQTLQNKDEIIDIKITDYLEQSKAEKRLQKGIRTGVEYPEKELEIDPYIFGLWLGDSKLVQQNPSWTFLKENNLIKNKYIPFNYLVNSRENRLKLLAGILDSDGHLNSKTKTEYDFIQKNEKLFDDILILVRSLGFAAYKTKCTYAIGGPKKETYYRCSISGAGLEDIPVLLEHKKVQPRKRCKDVLSTGIKVKYAGRGPYCGFLLDGNHRFLLEDFTITHNTGKTFTMFGHENGNEELRGIIPRACDHLFHTINNNKDVIEVHVKCSFLEIYREQVRDLLLDRGNAKKKQKELGYIPSLRIRQHQKKGIYVQGLIEKYVYTPEEILETIAEGANHRSVASTALNNVSSRSHAVLTLHITQNMSDGSEVVSKMHLIDLAGSENVGKSEAKGTTLLEAQEINKSLSSLGNVIYALTEKGRSHVPYRDSRLTYLLQDSLGGNSKTILITTATPHSSVYSETLNTFKFGKRVKEIKNIPKVNRNESNAKLIKTVAMLTRQLAELKSKYDDAQAIVEKVQKTELSVNSKAMVALKTRCERLESKLEIMKEEKEAEKKRREETRGVFERQRQLAQSVASQLYDERLKLCAVKNQLEQYKSFYDSIKGAVATPDVLLMMVKHANIKPKSRRSLSIDAMNSMPSVEIDSPTG